MSCAAQLSPHDPSRTFSKDVAEIKGGDDRTKVWALSALGGVLLIMAKAFKWI